MIADGRGAVFGRIEALAVKEFIQLIRDRLMTAFLVLFPIVQLIFLAQATGRGIHDLSLAVVDQDRSAQSRSLAIALDNVPELTWRFVPADPDELSRLVQTGQIVAGVVIPPGFGARLSTGSQPVTAQVIIDGSNTVAARTAQGAIEGVINDFVRRWIASRGPGIGLPMTIETAARYNPSLSSHLFTIPAQMGFIVYQVTLAVASLAFARERELGTLEQLLVMPLRRIELISGKAVLAWLVGGIDFLLMYWIVVNLFQIPMRGSFALLLGFSMLFVAVEIGVGVLISGFARTQQQAILYVFLLAMLEMALSGYLVPVKNMPALFRLLAQVSPLQHYLTAIRAIMLKGVGLLVLWPEAVALVAIGGVIAAVAVKTAARRLE
jgi:ABC-type multidrug transport system permease subunit